jgi:hypothetical protein
MALPKARYKGRVTQLMDKIKIRNPPKRPISTKIKNTLARFFIIQTKSIRVSPMAKETLGSFSASGVSF